MCHVPHAGGRETCSNDMGVQGASCELTRQVVRGVRLIVVELFHNLGPCGKSVPVSRA